MGCRQAKRATDIQRWPFGLAVVYIRVSGLSFLLSLVYFSHPPPSTLMQESRSLSAIEDLSPGETEEHIRDMTEIRDSWAQLVDRQRSHLKALERHIEGVRAQLFRAERKELAGLKKF